MKQYFQDLNEKYPLLSKHVDLVILKAAVMKRIVLLHQKLLKEEYPICGCPYKTIADRWTARIWCQEVGVDWSEELLPGVQLDNGGPDDELTEWNMLIEDTYKEMMPEYNLPEIHWS